MICPCGCGVVVKPGRVWAKPACYWRAQTPEVRRQRAIKAVSSRKDMTMHAAHQERARDQRAQTVDHLLTLAVEHGRVREAIQRAYLAGYTAGWQRRTHLARKEAA